MSQLTVTSICAGPAPTVGSSYVNEIVSENIPAATVEHSTVTVSVSSTEIVASVKPAVTEISGVAPSASAAFVASLVKPSCGLVTSNVPVGLVPPIVPLRLTVSGATITFGEVPEQVSEYCGLGSLTELLVNSKVPVRLPRASGVQLTSTITSEPPSAIMNGATVVENAEAFGPVKDSAVTSSVEIS